jgi:hypothetical protein
VSPTTDLGIVPANQSDESKNNRKYQHDVNETTHRVLGEQAQEPQQQQYDHCNSDHWFSPHGGPGTNCLDLSRERDVLRQTLSSPDENYLKSIAQMHY